MNDIDPDSLSDFGVDIRYPGDFYNPSDEETLKYKELAISIKLLIENKIEDKLSSFD